MAAAPPSILHLIERFTLGGASRSLLAAAAHSSQSTGAQHRIISLRPAHPGPAQRAEALGIRLAAAADLAIETESADVVHVHFWNTPDLYAALRTGLAPARILLTSHVAGNTVPHILTEEVIQFADHILLTSHRSLDDADEDLRLKASVAPSIADFARLKSAKPVPHDDFVVGYVGTVDFAKMHPAYVAIHASLDIPELRVVVAGEGGGRSQLEREISASGRGERFELRGYVEDIAALFGELDVFGYPLRAGSYATTELVVHEAMYAGLPCVVFADRGGAEAIRDGETGFIVANEEEYRERIRFLRDRPEERHRVGQAAAAYARAHFGAAHLAPLIDVAYERLMAQPKRRHALALAEGAEAFMRSLGKAAGPFAASLAGGKAADAADRAIAEGAAALASADAGGVVHYRRFYPGDPALRFWAGLVLLGQGRPALAAAEFRGAQRGFDTDRSEVWLTRAIRATLHQ